MDAGGDSVRLLHQLCAGLTPERADALRHAYTLVRSAVSSGYEEVVSGKMIAWVVPLSRFPKTYNKQPLMMAALAATKGHNALHLPLLYMSPVHDAAFRQAYEAAGRRLDMGKGCVRFSKVEDLDEQAIAEAIGISVEAFLAAYEAARSGASSSA